jgi:hypothetical protein
VNFKNTSIAIATFSLAAMTGIVNAQKVDLVNNEKEKKVEVIIDGKAIYLLFLSRGESTEKGSFVSCANCERNHDHTRVAARPSSGRTRGSSAPRGYLVEL